ncbi:MAG: DUF4926 domain-containing protein [Nitrospirales bacterium]|nr:DUF4926 domain-containing protein [Nitrospirales bacterium]
MIQELEDVILESDLPQNGLQRGDIGTIVLVHQEGKGYEMEFTTWMWRNGCRCHAAGFSGSTSHKREIAHARDLADSTP